MQEKRIGSIQKVDFSGLKVPFIAVYKSPEDFPGQCVARIYELDKPMGTIMVRGTLAEIQEDIREHTDKIFIPRKKEDVPSLAGVWI